MAAKTPLRKFCVATASGRCGHSEPSPPTHPGVSCHGVCGVCVVCGVWCVLCAVYMCAELYMHSVVAVHPSQSLSGMASSHWARWGAQPPQPTLGSRVTVCVLCACVVCVSTVYVCAELWMHSVVAAVHRSTRRGVASRAA
jgi:hypothetical protein